MQRMMEREELAEKKENRKPKPDRTPKLKGWDGAGNWRYHCHNNDIMAQTTPAHKAPVPMLDNPFSEEIFPNIQSKPPLAQLEAISSCPIACYFGKEIDTHLTTTSFQRAIRSPLSLLFSRLNNPSSFSCSSSDFCSRPFTSFVALLWTRSSTSIEGPKLNTVFEVWPHQCRVQGDNHSPCPAGHTISDASQDAIGLLGHLGTLLAHIQLAIDQHPQVLFHWATFQPLFPKPVALHGVVVTQVQDPALSLVEPHTTGLSPLIQPVQIPLAFVPSSRPTLPPNLVSSANLLRVHSMPSSRSFIKVLNRTGPSTEPWGTPLVTGRQLE
ncbi:LOW QUALITY PROTEIN: hypothetical protein QYF61_004366 [Mycteria americana]|uniref:Uncharacterized protein n=1 Tax=Mycteria americana TaxID=33587 RepID=A0AAN7N8Q9_MYCAM|nr:LOW QUALITY PROTEIN: hypothetical protein QYF61_004366 [Mycteria americana]